MKLSQYNPKAILVAVVATLLPFAPAQAARCASSSPREFGQPAGTSSEPERGFSPDRPQQNDGVDRSFAGRVPPSAGPSQHGSKVPLPDALERSGYIYIRVGEGVWKIPAISKRLRALEIRVSSVKGGVTLAADIMDRKNLEVTGAFSRKVAEMNRRFKPIVIALSRDVLSAKTDIGPQPVGESELVSMVERMVDVADEVYEEVRPFIPLIPPDPSSPGTNAEGGVDTKPVALNRPKPLYTEEARRQGVEGVVLVRVFIDEDGFVKDAVVLKGLANGLDDEALIAAYQLRFKPATKGGRPVTYRHAVQVKFELPKED
jgi:protein TonB